MNEEALLRAALDSPDTDDVPWLVYADWVEEHGEPERAAFIRTQYALDRTRFTSPGHEEELGQRVGELWEAHGDEWVARLAPLDFEEVEYQRGVLAALRLGDVEPAGWEKLSTLISVEYLELRGDTVTDDRLSWLLPLRYLTHLELRDCPVTDAGLLQLMDLPRLFIVEQYGTLVTEEGQARFWEEQQKRFLTLPPEERHAVALRYTALLDDHDRESCEIDNVDDVDDGQFVYFSALPELSVLKVWNCRLRGEGLRHLIGLPELRELAINGEHLTTTAGLEQLTPLERLTVSGHRWTAEDLARVGRLTRLEMLDLEMREAAPDVTLEFVAGLTRLSRLSLSGWTGLTDDLLAPVRNLVNLYDIFLEGSGITDAGLAHLRDLPKLEYVGVDGTAVTPAAHERLLNELSARRRSLEPPATGEPSGA
jgi:uncharacterized protein (TIGR02996 family)